MDVNFIYPSPKYEGGRIKMDGEQEKRARLLLREEQLADQIKILNGKLSKISASWTRIGSALRNVQSLPMVGFSNCDWHGGMELLSSRAVVFGYDEYKDIGIDNIIDVMREWRKAWDELESVRRELDRRDHTVPFD